MPFPLEAAKRLRHKPFQPQKPQKHFGAGRSFSVIARDPGKLASEHKKQRKSHEKETCLEIRLL
jgi:hypothetical protein